MQAFIGIGGIELFFILGVLAFLLVFPIVALVDVVRSDFRGPNDKVIWVIIIVFLNLIGALLYIFIGRKQRIS
ncbi:PLDc N-terminal domain-containing protein [Spirosoma fluviale]|uniref:Phospholipase_D-nuclease N-terminal n=1 Tax=Spirosoma fluviale TaxID=1597977 RepID=A0A286G9T2_9BACT|nr:PLDc N-terminal domain-containing protein [Spirosoma fluviale]SOD91986.1 Phospholipase_D-nuclease N-terminal [Spirosoma fluviale]